MPQAPHPSYSALQRPDCLTFDPAAGVPSGTTVSRPRRRGGPGDRRPATRGRAHRPADRPAYGVPDDDGSTQRPAPDRPARRGPRPRPDRRDRASLAERPRRGRRPGGLALTWPRPRTESPSWRPRLSTTSFSRPLLSRMSFWKVRRALAGRWSWRVLLGHLSDTRVAVDIVGRHRHSVERGVLMATGRTSPCQEACDDTRRAPCQGR